MASAEPVIHDLRTKEEDSTFSDQNLLRTFISPVVSKSVGVSSLHQPDGSCIQRSLPEKLRALPKCIFYDTVGLEAFNGLMHCEDEYYLTACEKRILESKAKEITAHIPDNASIFDLGAGSMEKTKVLIDYLRISGKKGIKVYGVDIDKPYLKNSLSGLIRDQKKQKAPGEDEFEFIGLHATFEEAIPFIQKIEGPKVFLLLGSTIGNINRTEASDFIYQFRREAMKPGDCFYIGIDSRKDPKIIARAYQDSKNYMYTFCMHGLDNLDKRLGGNLELRKNFELIRGYNDIEGCHEIFYKSLVDQTIQIPPPYSGKQTTSVDVCLKEGELIDIYFSYKYSQQELRDMAAGAKLELVENWSDLKDMSWFCLLKACSDSNKENCS